MALSRPSSRPGGPSWTDEIREEAVGEFDGEITIRRPGTPGKFDPISGTRTGGVLGEVVIPPRPARAVPLRLPGQTNDGNGAQASRRYRFQCEMRPGDPTIDEGLVVTFTGGDDPRLAKMSFQVKFASNGSAAALRTIETVTEGDRG